jgi:hypothetical protein
LSLTDIQLDCGTVSDREIVAVAVLARRGRNPFGQSHLDEAMAWIGSTNRWADLAVPSVVVQ